VNALPYIEARTIDLGRGEEEERRQSLGSLAGWLKDIVMKALEYFF